MWFAPGSSGLNHVHIIVSGEVNVLQVLGAVGDYVRDVLLYSLRMASVIT